jgi:ATP-dependent DNA helicase RecQ
VEGGPEQLYDGLLVIKSATSYICRSGSIPNCSTGYWLPDRQLTLVYRGGKLYYKYPFGDEDDWYNEALAIKYVGYADPIPRIPAYTLVRVSLARWFRPQGVSESRCYLQISGWYL